MSSASVVLIIASILCVIAAVLHFACISWGAAGYRFLGAGDNVVTAVEAGDRRPHISAIVVGSVLLVWAAYALAGAGVFPAIPLMRPVLLLISIVLLARSIAFPLLRPLFPGNSKKFWYVSSFSAGALGLLFLFGVLQGVKI